MRYKKDLRILTKRFLFLGSLGVIFVLVFFSFSFTHLALASQTIGTIDGAYKYAWGENIGWINFACDGCNVSVTDSSVSGNAWSTQYGWINLNPTNSGVTNNNEGALSGFAWSSNLGWIDFNGVTIDSNGEFLGYATVKSDNSQINFNCVNGNSCGSADFKVKTDWRKSSLRDRDSSSGSRPRPPTIPPVTAPTILPPITPPILPPVITPLAPTPVLNSLSWLDRIFNFFNPKKEPEKAIVEIPKITPLSFSVLWNLLPVKAIRQFVFAPLPYEVRILAIKFPELDNTLKSVGIKRLTDLSKLSGVTLNLPGLTELTNTLKNVGAKRLANINKLNNVTLNTPGLLNTINQKIPANIGISSAGMKVVHTHDTTGTIHVETPYPTQLHLRDFFTIWNKMFNSTCIFENCKDESHELLMFVDGEENTEFENLPLQDKQQIKIGYIEKE